MLVDVADASGLIVLVGSPGYCAIFPSDPLYISQAPDQRHGNKRKRKRSRYKVRYVLKYFSILDCIFI